MLSSVRSMFRIPELRRQLMVTFALLVVYRLGFHVFLPGVNVDRIQELIKQQSGSAFGALLNFAGAITGGGLNQAHLFSLGIMPYISASIIFSLLVKVIPWLEQLSKEGESGRKKINQYTRYATVGLCLVQSMFVVAYLRTGGGGGPSLVIGEYDTFFFYVSTVLALTTGSLFVMWLGEQITEFGVGNGISLIIMAGIIAQMPATMLKFVQLEILNDQFSRSEVFTGALKFLLFLALFVAVVIACVIMQQGQRRIPIQQQKHTRGRRVYGGQRHFMPFRVNSAGVMPVIFAQSLLIIPAILLSFIGLGDGGMVQGTGFWGIVLTIVLVYFFTYFWISLQFNPVEMANNMKEYGSFIPGIRPGRNTAVYLETIMNRITMVGAAFLSAVTVFPTIVTTVLDVNIYMASFLGGTGILIVVSVALDIVQKVESHLLMRHYEGFGRRGRGGIRRRGGGR
ncbi:preprotein translocase subunit SecY [Planctomycetota bacterium]